MTRQFTFISTIFFLSIASLPCSAGGISNTIRDADAAFPKFEDNAYGIVDSTAKVLYSTPEATVGAGIALAGKVSVEKQKLLMLQKAEKSGTKVSLKALSKATRAGNYMEGAGILIMFDACQRLLIAGVLNRNPGVMPVATESALAVKAVVNGLSAPFQSNATQADQTAKSVE